MEERNMKKIFISLAAIAALVSCVEEKGLEPQPQQPVGNQVTIKAVAAETKTALAADGTSIVWENGDAISMIFDYGEYKSSVICTTELDAPNSTAEFTGDLTDIESAKVAENVNLLYPADAFDNLQSKITFKVPAEQDGTVGSGENLSYALLTKTEIAGGTAVAQFTNALSLFKITVPAGVKTVTLTANRHLSGTGTYKFNEAGELILNSTDQGSSNNTVVLNSESGLDADRTYDVLVYPGDVTSLTLELTGVDGASYSKTLKHDDNSVYMTLEAGKYYNLKMANIFQWNTETALSASPLGGELEIKTSTTADFDYDVNITNADGTGTPDWISTTPLAKGFHQDVIVLYVDQNTSGETREAKVTVAYGEEKSQVFTVTQSSAFMDFVYTEENPIEWEETFGLYSDESLTSELATFTNVFTIELSDDFSKGTYKLKNLFVVDMYYGEGFQMITNKGGDYYANYDAATGNLTVLKANAVASYTFPDDVVLTYDSANKTFSAATLTVTLLNGSAYYSSGATRYIGGYAAEVKEEQEIPSYPYAYLFGDYTESFNDSGYYGSPSKGILTIAQSDDANYDLKMTFFGGTSAVVTVYANVSDDGTTLTTVQPAGYTNMGTFYASTLTLSDLSYGGPIWGTLNFDYPTINDYTATKQ